MSTASTRTYATGKRERIPLDGVVGATEAIVKGPDGSETHTPVLDGLATFYGTQQGYYDVTALGGDGKPMASISLAANLASAQESDIAPSAKLTLGAKGTKGTPDYKEGKQLKAPEPFPISRSQKLWWYFIAIAMFLVMVEWLTYHRRITV